MDIAKKIFKSYNVLLLAVMFLIIVILSFLSPYFLTVENFRNVLNQSSLYLFLVIGMSFVIASGNIDLAVGSIIGFTGMVMSEIYHMGVSAIPTIAIGLVSAFLIGALNGFFVTHFKINSFIVTLCSMTILRGIILLVTHSRTLFGFGLVFEFIGSGEVGPINMPILISLVTVIIADFVMRRTNFGNYTLFLGSNEVALSRMGVKTSKYKILIFALSGLLAGIAGVIVMGRLDSAEPLAGTGYEMDAIAAVILGGTVLEGGKGSIVGPFIACIILNLIKDGLTLMGVSTHWQEIVTGIIIIISVLISDREARRRLEV